MTARLTISPAKIAARPGETIRLTCQPAGPGPYTIEWQKVDGALSPTAVERQGVLEIRQVTPADAGQYRCIASNNAGSSEGYAVIDISGMLSSDWLRFVAYFKYLIFYLFCFVFVCLLFIYIFYDDDYYY